MTPRQHMTVTRLAYGIAALAVVTLMAHKQPNGTWLYDPGAYAVTWAYVLGTVLDYVTNFFTKD